MEFSRFASLDLRGEHLDRMIRLRWQDPMGQGEHLIQGRLSAVEHDRRGATVTVDVGGFDVNCVLWPGRDVEVSIAGE